MAEQSTPQTPSQTPAVDAGNYELIRGRLENLGRDLGTRVEALNQRRQAEFGSTALTIIGNERVRTEHNCIPRDIVAVGDRLLFAYNVFMGLKTQTAVGDVFSLHHFKETPEGIDLSSISPEDASALKDPNFVRDFEELYKYYKDSRLVHLRKTDVRMLAVFQTSATARDYKVFRWSVSPDGNVQYIDNRGEREYVFPPSHDFEWTLTTREDHVPGRFPHVRILDACFVETTGGDLTIKVENNTESGAGIYSEPVEDRNQSLDDAEIAYAQVGVLILLRVKPYREDQRRYLVFNTRTRTVSRIDAIGQACVQLPNDHGIIFPGGYYLNTGELKLFAGDTTDMRFESVMRAPNGEDVLYVFYQPREGRSILLPYNLIRKEVQNPISGHGYCIFPDGKMLVFRAESEEPTRVHPMQIWQTPFQSAEFAANAPRSNTWMGKIGNAELVRGISDCNTLRRMIDNQTPSAQTYEDLIAAATRTLDAYTWFGAEEAGQLAELIKQLQGTAEKIIDEFEKVIAIRKRAEDALTQARKAQGTLKGQTRPDTWTSVTAFVDSLDQWRRQQGLLFGLRELRYMELPAVSALEKEAKDQLSLVTLATVKYLSQDKALEPFRQEIDALHTKVGELTRSIELQPLRKKVTEIASRFELLTEIVSGLKIEDPELRTKILERISEVYAQLNRTKSHADNTYKAVLGRESVAQFGVEFKLFGQAVVNALNMADTPERCDEQLSRLTVQLEELEARFGELDQFMGDLATKREEVLEAFEARKRQLLEERNRKAQNLVKAADRIIQGIVKRAQGFSDGDQLNTFFVADPMVGKVRELSEQLRVLGDGMRADELLSRLKAARQEATRSQRDRAELFEEGPGIIKLGRHKFSVSTQPVELTLLPRDGVPHVHLTGTDFFDPITDPRLFEFQQYWDQQLVSEDAHVYRAEYLALSMYLDAEDGKERLSLEGLLRARESSGGLLAQVREYASTRYEEGYERGVHDVDAEKLLSRLLDMRSTAGLLRYAPEVRAFALLTYAEGTDEATRQRWGLRARSLGRLAGMFRSSPAIDLFSRELGKAIHTFCQAQGLPMEEGLASLSGEYLFEELRQPSPRFIRSGEAARLKDALLLALDGAHQRDAFVQDLQGLGSRLAERFQLAEAWVDAFLKNTEDPGLAALQAVRLEVVAGLLVGEKLPRETSSAVTSVALEGLLGGHSRVVERKLLLRFDELLTRVGRYKREVVPRFMAWRALRQELIEKEKVRLRLREFQPRVLTSFVRNKLINDVYLPLIGDNLAKQIGALGEGRRTDLMGMLLLISPPGYGKTTLMEYVANRLGLIFMKINGPSLGHSVVSIDPQEAPNAAARQEVDKINLALEMGNNVMLYLDDIQHTNPEFLQKFISLCDATRKIEGVWKGKSRTYDLKGKRFCVVMAGNPYTETGETFRIPDMLANRADTYNLGDILNGREDAFALSYLENALTSNAVLSPLPGRDPGDLHVLFKLGRGEEADRASLKHDYTQGELEEVVSVLQKLFAIQEVVLKVNLQYIASAGQADEYRTEPPFKLQGSYRNMNKMAEKVLPVMNATELQKLILDHYTGEAQTLTSGAEQNLLKLAELRGLLTPEQADRWKEIKKSFNQRQLLGGEDDPVAKVAAPLSALVQELRDVRETLDAPVRQALVEQVQALTTQVGQVQVGVGQRLEGLARQLSSDAAAQRHALQEGVGQRLEGLSSQWAQHRASLESGLGQLTTQLNGGLGQLTTQLNGGIGELGLTVVGGLDQLGDGLGGQLNRVGVGLAQQLQVGFAQSLPQALGQQLQGALGVPLAQGIQGLGQQLAELRQGLASLEASQAQQAQSLRGSLEQLVAAPLGMVAAQVERHAAGVQAALAQQVAPGLAALDKELEQLQQGLRTSLERVLSAQLTALVAQVERSGAGIEALSGQLASALMGIGGAVERQTAGLSGALDRQTTGWQQSLEGQLMPALGTLAERLEGVGRGLQLTVEQQVVPALVALDKELESLQQAVRFSLERAMTPQLGQLTQQVAGVKELLEQRLTEGSGRGTEASGTGASGAEVRGEGGAAASAGGEGAALMLLQGELKALRESMQTSVYRPLVAVAQQCDAMRRGLNETLSKGLLSRMDAMVERLNGLQGAVRSPQGGGLLEEVQGMGKELTALRQAVHEVTLVLGPFAGAMMRNR